MEKAVVYSDGIADVNLLENDVEGAGIHPEGIGFRPLEYMVLSYLENDYWREGWVNIRREEIASKLKFLQQTFLQDVNKVCKFCDKIHERVHTEEKLFKCNKCDYTCKQNVHLKIHKMQKQHQKRSCKELKAMKEE